MLRSWCCSLAARGPRIGCASKQAYEWVSLKKYPRRNACTAPAYRSLGKEMASQSSYDAVAPAEGASTCSSVGPYEEVSQPQEEAREPQLANCKWSFRFGSSSGWVQPCGAPPERSPRPCGSGEPKCGVLVRGLGKRRRLAAKQASESQFPGPRIPPGLVPVPNPDVGRPSGPQARRPARGIP